MIVMHYLKSYKK